MGTLLHQHSQPPPQQQQQIWGSRLSNRSTSHSSNPTSRSWLASPSQQQQQQEQQRPPAGSSQQQQQESGGIAAGRPSQSSPEDEIFDQMISDTSFDPPSNTASDHESPLTALSMQSSNTEANMFLPPNGLSVDVLQGRFDLAGPMTSKAPNTAPTGEPFSAAPSTFSSRRGSFDSAGIQRDVDGDGNEGSSRAARDRSASSAGTSNRTGQAVALRSFGGSAQNAITDAEIEFSTQAIARPAVNELKDLQIHVHGIQMQGHKSRVETQIRMRIELVRPAATAAEGGPKFERIGSFSHLKLPPLSGTKRNSKKYQRTDVDPQKTLYFDATVVNATPPHDRIFVCSGCMQRERKRLHRKKRDLHNAASAVPATLDGESVGNVVPPSVEEMKNMGFDPALPGAQERALQQMLKEDRKRVVVFNCGDYVDFFEGETILPTRITCYCRHHKAKVGFCIIFTMRDWQGRLLATGSTPPIMITDDHKTQGSSAKANGGVTGNSSTAPSPVASAGIRPGHSRVGSADSGDEEDDGVPQRQPSPSNNKSASVRNSAAGVVKGVQKKVKKERKKPYDDAGVRRRANGSGAAGLAMTPFAADGLGASPAESSATSPSNQDSSSIPAATPQQMLGNSPPNLPPDIVDAGSLSPSNLLTNPQSVPDFNLEFFLQQHGLQLNGSAGLPTAFNWPQLGALDPGVQGLNATGLPAAPFPVDMSLGPLTGGSDLSLGMPNGLSTQPESLFGPIPPAGSNAQTGADAPTGPQISKLIPGEGPTSGGIEVTILGENFEDGITCVFGDVPATNTRVWAANTLVCILPPSQSPGPVVVTLKGSPYSATLSNFRSPADGPLPLFTYIEASDRALMELALQVVGLQMTGAVQSARDVAMRVVGSGGSFGGTGGASGSSGQTQYTGAAGHQASTSAAVETQSRDAVSGFISSLARGRDASAHSSFQDSILNFLSLLDVNMDEVSGSTGRRDAIRLANKNGHTLLHLAVMLGFHRLAANLLRRGAPVNARDRNGYTALHFAALHGRVTLARLLLSGGARDNIPNWEGQLPIDIAREKDQIDVEMLLADTGSPAAEVHLAASHHDSGVSISERDDETATDRGLEDVEESDESGSTDDSSASEEDGSSRFGEDSALFADDEREASSSQIAFAGLAESDDGSAAGSVDSGRTARRAMAEPALALRAFLARAGDSVAAMEWAQRLHVPGTMDALQARLGTLHFNMRSLPGWPLGRPTARANDFGSPASAEGVQSDVPQRGANGAEHGADGPADPAQVGANPAHASGVSGIGNIAEWANTLFNAPPPTYEDALANEDRKLADSLSDADEKTAHADVDDKGEGTSASAYQQTLTAQEQQDAFVEQGSAQVEEEDEESGWEGEGQGSSHRSSPASVNSKLLPAPDPFRSRPQRVGASGSSSSGFTSSVKRRAVALTPRRARRSIYDDAMLFWFWIPALVAVIVVVFLSSGDGVLSFRDLVSYFDLGSSDSSSAAAAAAKQVAEAVVPRAVMPAAMAEGLAA